MERKTTIEEASKIMGKNFIGPKELKEIGPAFGISLPTKIPGIPFDAVFLDKIKKDYILVLALPVTINQLRKKFGFDPKKSQPCFYNQDWYLKEKFASKKYLKSGWYIIRKKIDPKTKGKAPDFLKKQLEEKHVFPKAVLVSYIFFTYYLARKEVLWKNNFIWCDDKDSNGDQIYVGRYLDPKKLNKNGFSVHRHLAIRKCYGLAPELK